MGWLTDLMDQWELERMAKATDRVREAKWLEMKEEAWAKHLARVAMPLPTYWPK